MNAPRIRPLEAPYDPAVQALFDRVMPPGMEPLLLFRTLATSARVFPRFMRAGVLDRGPLTLAQRELAILRTTARCGAEYEWGVHVTAFADAAGLSPEQVAATTADTLDAALFDPEQQAILALMDSLHEHAAIDAALWSQLAAAFEEAQILELIYIAGLYHAVSFFANGLDLAREPFAARFPEHPRRGA